MFGRTQGDDDVSESDDFWVKKVDGLFVFFVFVVGEEKLPFGFSDYFVHLEGFCYEGNFVLLMSAMNILCEGIVLGSMKGIGSQKLIIQSSNDSLE